MAKNTIKVKNYVDVVEEATAAGAITPGNAVSIGATGVVSRAAADYAGIVKFAVEDGFQGKTVSDDYATGDKVQIWVPTPGCMVYAVAGAAILKGALLSVAADGKVITATTGPVIGEAVEAVAADDARIIIEIK